MKKIKYGKEAQIDLMNGINKVADAVETTLGPKGRNVVIVKKWAGPTVTHDGVTVAKEMQLEDPFEDAGAQMIREAASKTNDLAGDGTTTATSVTRAMAKEGFKHIDAGANAQIVKSGIEKATNTVLKELDRLKKKLKPEDVERVATISAGSSELGKIVAEAINKAGENGAVTLNEVPTDEITIEHTEGMEIDRGFISSYFIVDDKNRAGVRDAYILITDMKLSSQDDILPFLDAVTPVSKNIVVIAEDVDGEALAMLVVNKLKGNFNALAIKAPAFGLRRKQILEDIAVLTGGTFISEETGRQLNTVTLEDLGQAERVTSDKGTTLIVNGKGSKTAIKERIQFIKNELEEATNEFDKDQIKERLAKLTSGVVVINVGGRTETAMKEVKFRIEDAVNATRAAIEEGIVPGGETALLKASRILDTLVLEGDEAIGVKVVKESLKRPFLKLMSNAGITDGELLAQAMKSKGSIGINVMTGKLSDLIEDGIIDPVKVSRLALTHASSAACNILTSEVVIVDVPEGKNES